MVEATHFEEGPVRITAMRLVTPAGSWSLYGITSVRTTPIEPDVGWIQGIFMLAFIATGVGLKWLWTGRDPAPFVLAGAAALFACGLLAARTRRPQLGLFVEQEGIAAEAWRSSDEAAVARVAAALEAARARLPVQTLAARA